MKPYLSFVRTVLGEHGYNAIQTAISQMPEIDSAVPAQTLLSWVETAARLSYEGIVPGTNHKMAICKSETGYSYSIDGIPGVSSQVRDAALALARALEFAPQSSPALNKSQMDQLIKTIDLLAKMSLVKAIPRAHGAAAPPSAAMSHTGAVGPTREQPAQSQAAASSASKKAISGLSEQKANKPSTSKVMGTGTTQPPMAGGTKGPAAAKPKAAKPKVGGFGKSEVSKPCPACGQKAFTDVKFVGCSCFANLAKNTYSKAVEDGFVIFFNFQWDDASINKLLKYYKD